MSKNFSRSRFAATAHVSILFWIFSMGFASSQTPSESPKQTSLSPDKKWEFSPGQEAILNKAGTGETVVKFSDDCESGALSENPKLQWAPDSRRFAFYACGGGKEHLTLLYQLGDEGWKALKTPGDDDELSKRASDNIDA